MTSTPSSRSDLKPLYFGIAVIIGGLGSAAMSYLHWPAWASVIFALTVMISLAFLAWRAASQFEDSQSLDAFAEDIYLLGYLLTLAALLGLAPRLMSDEANLFQIAGMKLVTTVVGLGLMMIFRQIARRWATDKEIGQADIFAEQQRLFSDAVARLNQSADDLTSKLNDVIHSFDPAMLVPVAEWSNHAAAAFSAATNALMPVPASIEAGKLSLDSLRADLERTKTAAAELAGILTAGTAQAAKVLATELGEASQAASKLGTSVAALHPAGDAARGALEKLGNQANADTAKLNDIGDTLHRTVAELGKAERALKKLLDLHANDPETPMNRLVQALETSAVNTIAATERFETIQKDLQSVATASQEIGRRMESQVGAPLVQHQQALDRVQQHMTRMGEQIERATKQLETTTTANRPDPAAGSQLVTQLGELRKEMSQTNTQIKTLISRFDASAVPASKPGLISTIFGGGGKS